MEYLDFELPVKELQEQIAKCQAIGDESSVDVTETCKLLTDKLENAKKKIYGNLNAWQRVQLSRHPSRPYTLDYINALCGDTFLELHGDRNFADDKAMVGGLGKIENQTFMFVGTQKGYNTKTRQYRNFGMAKPEGYRKALRLMKTAEKFGIPIISLIDTPGAYPGLGAEERGQGQAIANNIFQSPLDRNVLLISPLFHFWTKLYFSWKPFYLYESHLSLRIDEDVELYIFHQ